MDIDPRRLRILRAVALRGGVTDAARLLNLTASAVSQQLVQLETEAGMSLINRNQRRVTLTAAGELLARWAERIEQSLAEARRELNALSNRVSGSVTVIGFETAIRFLLVPALALLAKSHPDLHVRILEDIDPARMIRELRTGGADLVVTEREVHTPEPVYGDLVVHPLLEDEYKVIVPASWAPGHTTIRELADAPWIIGPIENSNGQAFKYLREKMAFTPDCVHVVYEFPTMISLVAGGQGVALVSRLALMGAEAQDIAVTPIASNLSRRFCLVYRQPRFGPDPKIATVIAAMEEVARNLGFPPARLDGFGAPES
jgi:DNA-binding transcriptional LysR family regulator